MSQDTFVTLRINKKDYDSKLNRRGSWSNFESSLKKVPSSVSQFLSKSSTQPKTPPTVRKTNDNDKSAREALWLSSNILNNVTAELCYNDENEADVKSPFRIFKSSSFRLEKNPIIRVIGETFDTSDGGKSDKKKLCKSSSDTFPIKRHNDKIKSKCISSETFANQNQNIDIGKKISSSSSDLFPSKPQNKKIDSKNQLSDTFPRIANRIEIGECTDTLLAKPNNDITFRNKICFSNTLPTKPEKEETTSKGIFSDTLPIKPENVEVKNEYSSLDLPIKPEKEEVKNNYCSVDTLLAKSENEESKASDTLPKKIEDGNDINRCRILTNFSDVVPIITHKEIGNRNSFLKTMPTKSYSEEKKSASKISNGLETGQNSNLPTVLVSRLVFGNSKIENGSCINGWSKNIFDESKDEPSFLKQTHRMTQQDGYHRMTHRMDNFFDNNTLESIILETLDKSTVMMSYDPVLSINRAQHISKELVKTVKQNLSQDKCIYKVVAQVFLGALKDNGFYFATQCSFEPHGDLFASSIVNTNDMFVCAIVKAEKCLSDDI